MGWSCNSDDEDENSGGMNGWGFVTDARPPVTAPSAAMTEIPNVPDMFKLPSVTPARVAKQSSPADETADKKVNSASTSVPSSATGASGSAKEHVNLLTLVPLSDVPNDAEGNSIRARMQQGIAQSISEFYQHVTQSGVRPDYELTDEMDHATKVIMAGTDAQAAVAVIVEEFVKTLDGLGLDVEQERKCFVRSGVYFVLIFIRGCISTDCFIT